MDIDSSDKANGEYLAANSWSKAHEAKNRSEVGDSAPGEYLAFRTFEEPSKRGREAKDASITQAHLATVDIANFIARAIAAKNKTHISEQIAEKRQKMPPFLKANSTAASMVVVAHRALENSNSQRDSNGQKSRTVELVSVSVTGKTSNNSPKSVEHGEKGSCAVCVCV